MYSDKLSVLPYPNLFVSRCVSQRRAAVSVTFSVFTNPGAAKRLINQGFSSKSVMYSSLLVLQPVCGFIFFYYVIHYVLRVVLFLLLYLSTLGCLPTSVWIC